MLSQSKRIIKTSDKRTSFKNHFLLNIKQTGRPLQGQEAAESSVRDGAWGRVSNSRLPLALLEPGKSSPEHCWHHRGLLLGVCLGRWPSSRAGAQPWVAVWLSREVQLHAGASPSSPMNSFPPRLCPGTEKAYPLTLPCQSVHFAFQKYSFPSLQAPWGGVPVTPIHRRQTPAPRDLWRRLFWLLVCTREG